MAALAPDAGAIGLGSASLQSGLGERLRLSFPVSTQPDEDVGCVQVRARGDDLPSVFNTRTNVIRNGFQTRVEVTSAQPVNEPAIGLVVSVGCASPVSREYVLFLDPPAVAPELPMETGGTVAATEVPRRAARPVGRRRSATPAARQADADALVNGSPPGPAIRRPPRQRTPAVTGDAPLARSRPAPPVAARTPSPSSRGRDRLTIAPNEPLAAAPLAPSSPSTVTPVTPPAPAAAGSGTLPGATPATTLLAQGSTGATPAAGTGAPAGPAANAVTNTAASAPTTVATTPAVPAAVPLAGPTTAAVAGPAAVTAEAAAREQAMRGQQAEMQRQVKALSDQIAALRVQTTTLATRNQTLESSAATPFWTWILAALAALATLVAGWLAWRYTQLRRSVDGAAWWTGNTVHTPADADAVGGETRSGLTSLDAGTRMAGARPVAQTDTRGAPPAPQAAMVSNVEKARPVPRSAAYPAAIDTDFTVSDIEAAMATVRTVSPPREAPRANPLAESDFTALGGPTLPSPFAEPPPRAPKVVERDGDNVGKFLDLDIPPLPAGGPRPFDVPSGQGTARPAAPAPAAATPVPPRVPTAAPGRTAAAAPARTPTTDEASEPLDFKLDITQPFDPLGTDSHKTTVVDPLDAREAVDFELPGSPMPLDFELPPADASGRRTDAGLDDGDAPIRHGATALNDLFPTHGNAGPDTILDLDERHGAPLSTTEVDRLTTTAVEGNGEASAEASPRMRMARFADLMNQVDEAAQTDPLRAIAHLRQYVLRDEQIPTLLWLRLFELYRKVDKKPVFEALGEHFARRYHRPMVGWSQTLADRVPQTPLSAMGPIDREIEASWGRDEGLERLRSLLCDRDQPDSVVFNAVLQRDLLDAAKVFPTNTDPVAGAT